MHEILSIEQHFFHISTQERDGAFRKYKAFIGLKKKRGKEEGGPGRDAARGTSAYTLFTRDKNLKSIPRALILRGRALRKIEKPFGEVKESD